ncbi:hypothetical protein ABGB18_11270 [Nonomuraea sp. B12E4]|uniref:hypothetical protein n=1 Tax=Nonomuraea sp. B12E4 TaxID=3153564 RepID=UPI00325F336C
MITFTFGQTFVVAVVAGVFGIGLGALMVATYRSRRRPDPQGREIEPPTRLERILREDAASRPLTRSEIKQQFGVDVHDVFEEDR